MLRNPPQTRSTTTRPYLEYIAGDAPKLYSGSVPPAAFTLPSEVVGPAEKHRDFKGLRGKVTTEAIFFTAIAGAIREYLVDCWRYRRQH